MTLKIIASVFVHIFEIKTLNRGLFSGSVGLLDLPKVDSHNFFSGYFKISLNAFLKKKERAPKAHGIKIKRALKV